MKPEMIRLQRESIAAGTSVRVLELPKWIRPPSRSGAYWHIPRAAMDFGDRLSVLMWCGVHTNMKRARTGTPPEGMKCGTCFGRFSGARGNDGLVFSPRDHFAPPKLCPGWPDDTNHCVLCGDPCRWWGQAVQRHTPGPGFHERCQPCPDHAWRNVCARNDRLVCADFVGFEFGYCEFDCGPRTRL